MPEAETNFWEHLERLTECSLCLDTCQDPRRLRCGHSFCFGCLETLLKSDASANHLKCPNCRADQFIGYRGLEKLPKDYIMIQLNDVIAKDIPSSPSSSTEEKSGRCDYCSKTFAKTDEFYYCFDCDSILCTECCTRHRCNKERAAIWKKMDFTYSMICDIHVHPVRFLCQTCNNQLCMKCVRQGECDYHMIFDIFGGMANDDRQPTIEKYTTQSTITSTNESTLKSIAKTEPKPEKVKKVKSKKEKPNTSPEKPMPENSEESRLTCETVTPTAGAAAQQKSNVKANLAKARVENPKVKTKTAKLPRQKAKVIRDKANETTEKPRSAPKPLRIASSIPKLGAERPRLALSPPHSNAPSSFSNMSVTSATHSEMPITSVSHSRMPATSVTHSNVPVTSVSHSRMPVTSVSHSRMPVTPATHSGMPVTSATYEDNPPIQRSPASIENETVVAATITPEQDAKSRFWSAKVAVKVKAVTMLPDGFVVALTESSVVTITNQGVKFKPKKKVVKLEDPQHIVYWDFKDCLVVTERKPKRLSLLTLDGTKCLRQIPVKQKAAGLFSCVSRRSGGVTDFGPNHIAATPGGGLVVTTALTEKDVVKPAYEVFIYDSRCGVKHRWQCELPPLSVTCDKDSLLYFPQWHAVLVYQLDGTKLYQFGEKNNLFQPFLVAPLPEAHHLLIAHRKSYIGDDYSVWMVSKWTSKEGKRKGHVIEFREGYDGPIADINVCKNLMVLAMEKKIQCAPIEDLVFRPA